MATALGIIGGVGVIIVVVVFAAALWLENQLNKPGMGPP